jgi:hypothetical protein
LVGNDFANAPVDRQWFSSRHVIAATDTRAKTEEVLEAVLPVRSVPWLYNEGQLPLPLSPSAVQVKNPETAVRRLEVGVRWSPACEDLSPKSTVERRYQAV